MSPLQRFLERREAEGDAGTTLTEVMVGIVIMTIFGTIFTTSTIDMFGASNKTQAVESSSGQLNTAFEQLDQRVRYASVIDAPVTSPKPSVAFLTPAATVGSTATCTQLEIRRPVGATQDALMMRTWPQATPGTPTWSQLAYGVQTTDQNGAAVTSFLRSTPTGANVQQLQIQLVAVAGSGKAMTYSVSSMTFSALNSAAASTSPPVTPSCPAPDTS